MAIDEKKLPFYLLLRLEKFLIAKNQHLCYEGSFRKEFSDSLEMAWENKELSLEEYNYLKENYLEECGVLTAEQRATRYELVQLTPETYARIIRFSTDRDWDQFHSPSNLAKSISIEANELLECFQWSDKDYKLDKVKEELADVLVYCIDMLDKLNLSAEEIIREKMARNEAKYPVEKAKGSSKKYDEL